MPRDRQSPGRCRRSFSRPARRGPADLSRNRACQRRARTFMESFFNVSTICSNFSRVAASTSLRDGGSSSKSASETAKERTRSGAARSSLETLRPTPIKSRGPWGVSTRSGKMPPSLRPACSTSFGQRISSAIRARAVRLLRSPPRPRSSRPPRSVRDDRSRARGSRARVKVKLPSSDHQRLLPRPLPLVWRSAHTKRGNSNPPVWIELRTARSSSRPRRDVRASERTARSSGRGRSLGRRGLEEREKKIQDARFKNSKCKNSRCKIIKNRGIYFEYIFVSCILNS